MKQTPQHDLIFRIAALGLAAACWTGGSRMNAGEAPASHAGHGPACAGDAHAGPSQIPSQSHGRVPDAHAGHNHGPAAATADPVAATQANCEHKIPIYQCAECRYEVGVVKIDPSLWKSNSVGLLATQTVTNRRVRATMSLTGEVRLNENASARVSPRVAGVIESVAADLGTTVAAGDELFAIHSVEFGRALGDYERSRALTALSEKNYEREKMLVAQQAAPEQDLIEAQMTYEQHRTDFKAAEQTLYAIGLPREDVARLKDGVHGPAIGRLPVRSPLKGSIVERHAMAGEQVEPGREVMLVADLTTLWVWVNAYARDLAALVKAREAGPIPVAITVSAYPGRTFAGQIDHIGLTVDEQTRTVKLRATVANPDLALRPGMFCEALTSLGAEEETLTVPRAALVSDEGRDFVFVHWKDDYFMRRFVTRGRDFVGETEIRDGLKPGERIVTVGAFLLKSDVLREKMGAGCAD